MVFALIALEVGFWVSLALLILSRYWWRSHPGTVAALVLFALDTAGFAVVGIVELATEGKVSPLGLLAIGLAVYAATAGRAKARKLDARGQEVVAAYRESASRPRLAGLVAYAWRARGGKPVPLSR